MYKSLIILGVLAMASAQGASAQSLFTPKGSPGFEFGGSLAGSDGNTAIGGLASVALFDLLEVGVGLTRISADNGGSDNTNKGVRVGLLALRPTEEVPVFLRPTWTRSRTDFDDIGSFTVITKAWATAWSVGLEGGVFVDLSPRVVFFPSLSVDLLEVDVTVDGPEEDDVVSTQQSDLLFTISPSFGIQMEKSTLKLSPFATLGDRASTFGISLSFILTKQASDG